MTLRELQAYLQRMLDCGFSPDKPVRFRTDEGVVENIDYAVLSNDEGTILFAQEWYS